MFDSKHKRPVDSFAYVSDLLVHKLFQNLIGEFFHAKVLVETEMDSPRSTSLLYRIASMVSSQEVAMKSRILANYQTVSGTLLRSSDLNVAS